MQNRSPLREEQQQIIAYPLHGSCYLNITSSCTLRCTFCPKHNRTWEVQDYDLHLESEPSADEVMAAIGDPAEYRELVFCGLGEPTKRLDLLLDIAARLKKVKSRVRVNTDGLANLVHGRDVTPEMARVVDVVSISMNTQDEASYIRHTRPKLEGAYAAMLDFAVAARNAGMEVTLTAIDGLDGVKIGECETIAHDLGVNFRKRVMDEVG